jgi:hypothetical protein
MAFSSLPHRKETVSKQPFEKLTHNKEPEISIKNADFRFFPDSISRAFYAGCYPIFILDSLFSKSYGKQYTDMFFLKPARSGRKSCRPRR